MAVRKTDLFKKYEEYRNGDRPTQMAQDTDGSVAAAVQQIGVNRGLQAAEDAGTLTPTQGYLKYLDAYKNNRFQYDQNTDPIYQQAREAAMRQGQLASKDVQAQAAQLTGGYGNSYGAMAAGQAYNQYLQGVNDMVPELANAAYGRYADEQQRNLTLTQMYMDMENRDYNRKMTEAQLAAQYGDYGGLNGLGIDTSEYENKEALDRAWDLEQRDRQRTEWTQEDEARMWQFALQFAQYGDYSKLKDLGVDVSTQQRRDALEEALQYAQVYDYSKLRALGVNTDLLEAQKAATMAGLYGSGSTGGGRSSGGGKSGGGSGGSGGGAGGNEDDGEKRFFEQDLSDAVRAFGLVKNIVQIPGTTTNTLMGTDADGDKHKIIINKETGIAEVVY